MTDYANVLADLCKGEHSRQGRKDFSVKMLDRTPAEATIIEDAVTQAIRGAAREVGAAIDTVSAFDGMQADVVAQLCHMLPINMEMLAEMLLRAALDMMPVTPGCTCDACKSMNALTAQVHITQGER